jgi:hypothetical protein
LVIALTLLPKETAELWDGMRHVGQARASNTANGHAN